MRFLLFGRVTSDFPNFDPTTSHSFGQRMASGHPVRFGNCDLAVLHPVDPSLRHNWLQPVRASFSFLLLQISTLFVTPVSKMVKKRRNNGRNRHGRGHTRLVDCSHCMCKPAKDKAIGRFMVRNMVDAGALNDLKLASAYEGEWAFSALRCSDLSSACLGCISSSPCLYLPLFLLQSTRSPSCTPSPTTASAAPSTLVSSVSVTSRSAGSGSPRSGSGAPPRRRPPLKLLFRRAGFFFLVMGHLGDRAFPRTRN